MKLVLIGDGQSPHLLKWARALVASDAPRVQLWVASSRAFLPEFDALVPASHRLALSTSPRFEGGNAALLKKLPRLSRWLREVEPDWLNPHYLTSHGTLAWLATRLGGVKARIASSAWGSDILVAPDQSGLLRWVTRQVLKASTVCTSDSAHMTQRMYALGAREVMTFPFGLEALPPTPGAKYPNLFFANRGLEAIYDPLRVVATFAQIAQSWPDARLVVAHDGALRETMQAAVAQHGLADRVQFVGRLSTADQAQRYTQAQWYISLPRSDSVSVSVLEALGHGCIPILSDLPANRELVRDGDNGCILPPDGSGLLSSLGDLARRAPEIAQANHDWVAQHALFAPSVQGFLQRLAVA